MPDPETITLHRATLDGGVSTEMAIPKCIGAVRLLHEIGRGGMGVVWLGHHTVLHRSVAVKFLTKLPSDKCEPLCEAIMSRFLQEARAAAAVRHTGLVTVHDADAINGLPYLIMDYIDGFTLSGVLEQTGRLTMPVALAVMDSIGAAVTVLHDAGIIHRDIKPRNVLLDREGHIYVSDFGLALMRAQGVHSSTLLSAAGTPAYMAPELFDGEASTRSDVYALGVMMCQLLTGEYPFFGETLEDVHRAHREQPLPIDRLEAIAVGKPIIEILERATHKNPMFRTKTARQFAQALHVAVPDDQAWAKGRMELAEIVSRLSVDRSEQQPADTQPSPPTSYFDILATKAESKRQVKGAPLPADSYLQEESSALDKKKKRPPDKSPRCIKCGYSLHGLEKGRCPECGRVFDVSDPSTFASGPPSRWGRGFLAVAATWMLPGLGQWIVGRHDRALVWLCVNVILLPLVVGAICKPAWVPSLLLLVPIGIVVSLLGLVDAFLVGRRSTNRLLGRPLTRYLVGVMLILVDQLYSGSAYHLLEAYVVRNHVYSSYAPRMAPTLSYDDRILVHTRVPVARWNIAVFWLPSSIGGTRISRIVGLPGETVEIVGGNVRINGAEVPRPPGITLYSNAKYIGLPEQWGGNPSLRDKPGAGCTTNPIQLGADEYYVLSDSSLYHDSSGYGFPAFVDFDSRLWETTGPGHQLGALPADHIIGVVTTIYWPPSRWRMLP